MKHIILILFLLFSLTVFAENNYPVKVINGKKYYEYTIQKGEGLYRISQKFGVSQADLYACNSNLQDGLISGQVILVPMVAQNDSRESKVNDTSYTHIVKAKETLFGISRQYGLTVAELIALNPSATEGLKIGDVLTIKKQQKNIISSSNVKPETPKNQKPVTHVERSFLQSSAAIGEQSDWVSNDKLMHRVLPKETFFGISKKYNVTIADLLSANPNLGGELKIGDILTIPVSASTPSIINKNEKSPAYSNPISEKINSDSSIKFSNQFLVNKSSGALNVALLMPFMTTINNFDGSGNRFIDFYRGILLALNKIKSEGISVNLYVYDTGKTIDETDSVLNLLDAHALDWIIGPAYTIQLHAVTDYAKKKHIYTLVPFSSLLSNNERNEFVLQFNPPPVLLYDSISNKIIESRRFNNYIFANTKNNDLNKAGEFALEFKKVLIHNKIKYTEVNLTEENIDTLKVLCGIKNTLLIPETSDQSDIYNIENALTGFGMSNIALWGTDEWGTLLNNYSPLYYFSLFDMHPTHAYETLYHRNFGPNYNSMPRYDLLGYDIMLYIINSSNVPQFHAHLYDYLQTNPQFVRTGNNKGFINWNYYLKKYDGLEMKVIHDMN